MILDPRYLPLNPVYMVMDHQPRVSSVFVGTGFSMSSWNSQCRPDWPSQPASAEMKGVHTIPGCFSSPSAVKTQQEPEFLPMRTDFPSASAENTALESSSFIRFLVAFYLLCPATTKISLLEAGTRPWAHNTCVLSLSSLPPPSEAKV